MQVISRMIVEHRGRNFEVSYDDHQGSSNGCEICVCKDICNMSECSFTIGSNGYFSKEIKKESE